MYFQVGNFGRYIRKGIMIAYFKQNNIPFKRLSNRVKIYFREIRTTTLKGRHTARVGFSTIDVSANIILIKKQSSFFSNHYSQNISHVESVDY